MDSHKSSKLIKILRTFNEDEFSDFEKIASSPFFSYRRNYIPYIKALKKSFPNFEGEMFRKENTRKYVHSIVHPDSKYNDQYMKNIFSDLIHIAEETLYQKISGENNIHNQIFLAIEETKRELFQMANHNLDLVRKNIGKKGIDETYFFYKGMNEIAFSVLENKMNSLNHETGKPVTSGESFINFTIILTALSIYNSSARNAMLNLNGDKTFAQKFGGLIDLDGMEKLLLHSNDPDTEVILIFFYYLIHYYKKPGYSNFRNMCELAYRNHSRISPRMLFLVCSMLSSVLYELRTEIDSESFGKQYFEISLFSLKNKCYKVSEQSWFPFGKFRSYYLNAVDIGELDWVEKFALEYSEELSPDVREETLCLIRSNIYFEKGLYDDAYNELNKVKFKQLLYKFDMRALKMKIYFEKGLCLNAENSADSFNKFISNNKKTAQVFLNNFIIFSKYYKALIDIAHDKVKEPLMIYDEVIKSTAFPERRWLIGKIEKFAKLKAHYETAQ